MATSFINLFLDQRIDFLMIEIVLITNYLHPDF